MKQMHKDPMASDKARRAERKADERSGLISIKPMKMGASNSGSSGGGFKKGGFKNAFAPTGDDSKETEQPAASFNKVFDTKSEQASKAVDYAGSDTDDFDYEYYDPRKPTGCDTICRAP